MRCERGVEKSGKTSCRGEFCQPDGVDGAKIAQNFSVVEFADRLNKVKGRLLTKPESCELQAAYNQLDLALRMKGVFN